MAITLDEFEYLCQLMHEDAMEFVAEHDYPEIPYTVGPRVAEWFDRRDAYFSGKGYDFARRRYS